MRNDKLVPGVILVIIGGIFLLYNFNYINFHWENFAILWPLFIIVPGAIILLSIFKSPWTNILKIAIIVGAVGLLLFGNFEGKFSWWKHAHYYTSDNDDSDDDDDSDNANHAKVTTIPGNGEFKEPYKVSIKAARINISGGATTYRLSDTTDNLFKADTRNFKGKYEYDTHQDDSVYVMDFKMKDVKFWQDNNDNHNQVDISLNTRPIWDINVNAGATDLNFDLSKYKVRSVELNGGAAQFVLKMGQPLVNTNIEVSTGAADVTINVPKDAACQIETDGGFLASHDFEKDGFAKTDDDHYQTAGFENAKNKMYIHITGAISDFKVHQY